MLKTGWLRAGLTLAVLSAVASLSFGFGMGSAQAVVVCKTVGVPKGCVVRPAPVVAPVARATTRAAVSVGVNRGGPVNRRGVR